ncbi:MAG TPA: 16S rRNA (cytosine(1402)-N(4))-methyltransferase RsmH [Candidatus Gracilibacteria bacterium]
MITKNSHLPVLQKEILEYSIPKAVKTVFDGTLGLGGHGEAILRAFPDIVHYIGTDLEAQHLDFAKERLKNWHQKLILEVDNFSSIQKIVQKENIAHPLFILLDLGICSHHVDNAEKGFSYQAEGPLNMAFADQEKTAEVVVNTYEEADIVRILREYGEEPAAKKIAKSITQARTHQPLRTTLELRSIVEQSVHPRERSGAVKRTFQAIRIEVNGELEHLQKALHDGLEVMKKGDRMAVITYHSLEDRMVKQFFVSISKPLTGPSLYSLHEELEPAQAKNITKKPILPTPQEIESNPRARSAKLRIIEKL